MSALEQSLRALCDQHNLTAITIGVNLKQREEYQFGVTVHWDGFSTRDIGCTGVQGATIADALAATVARAITERTRPTAAVLADEALPVEIAA